MLLNIVQHFFCQNIYKAQDACKPATLNTKIKKEYKGGCIGEDVIYKQPLSVLKGKVYKCRENIPFWYIILRLWACSSVWQSIGLLSRGSRVQFPSGPLISGGENEGNRSNSSRTCP